MLVSTYIHLHACIVILKHGFGIFNDLQEAVCNLVSEQQQSHSCCKVSTHVESSF